MKLIANENELIGNWVYEEGKVYGDPVTQRIEWLITNQLEKIITDISGWDVIYKDNSDDRFWELTYPSSEMQGGGPPNLICILKEKAKLKYSIGL